MICLSNSKVGLRDRWVPILPAAPSEQIFTQEGGNPAITVNAVHVIIDNQLTGTLGDLILAHCTATSRPPRRQATCPPARTSAGRVVGTIPLQGQGQCVTFVASGGRSGGPA